MVPARWTVNDFHRFNFVQPLIFLIMSKGYQNSLLRFFRPTPYSKLFSYFFFINPRVIHVVNRTFKKSETNSLALWIRGRKSRLYSLTVIKSAFHPFVYEFNCRAFTFLFCIKLNVVETKLLKNTFCHNLQRSTKTVVSNHLFQRSIV